MRARMDLWRAAMAVLAGLALVLAGSGEAASAAAPAVTITQPGAESSTSSQTPSFLGTTDDELDPVTLSIYAGASATPERTLTMLIPLGALWSALPESPLAPGRYTAVAEQTNATAETGTSNAVTFTVDTTPPSVSMSALAARIGNPSPTLSGDAGTAEGDDPTVAVTVYEGTAVGGVVAASKSVSVGGSQWSYTTPHLGDGTYTAQAVQVDRAGNSGASAPVTFTVDTLAPSVSLFGLGPLTNDATPTLAGGAGAAVGDSATVAVTIYRGTSVGGDVVASSSAVAVSGSLWSYMSPHLDDGTYTAQAIQGDEAGNTEASAGVTFTVDTFAPKPTVLPVSSPSSDSTPLLGGFAGAQADGPVAVTIYRGTSVGGEVAASSPHAFLSGSKWFYAPPELDDGTYTARAVQTDEAGNTGASAPVTFTVDTLAPSVSMFPVGSPKRDSTPTLAGVAGAAAGDGSVLINIYKGKSAGPGGPALSSNALVNGAGWSYTSPALPDGQYTAQAVQRDEAGNKGVSATVTFVIDSAVPGVEITEPENGAILATAKPTFKGLAGQASGDRQAIILKLFPGTAVSGTPVRLPEEITPSQAQWSAGQAGSALANGIYTAVAEQSDDAGNTARSTATFAIGVPPAPPIPIPTQAPATPQTHSPPVASFQWVPSAPHVGEAVSLISNSTDLSSPITAVAWDLAGNGAFSGGPSVLGTSFSTVGAHVVRLQVTDADGLSSVIAKAVTVTAVPLRLMQPFPVVRIAGSESSSGVRISLLTVQAPVGARVGVACRGPACPTKSQRLTATASSGKPKAGMIVISFRRFQRSLRVGTVLEIRISKPGEIGKYTRFTVRRAKLPVRVDTCLAEAGIKPIACPSS
jgi:hypothetical protein